MTKLDQDATQTERDRPVEIEITEEMISVGVSALFDADAHVGLWGDPADAVVSVFLAMAEAANVRAIAEE